MSGACDSMTTGHAAAERLRAGRKGPPAQPAARPSRLAARPPSRPISTAATGSKAPPAPSGSARKKGTGGGTRRQGERSGRASNRAGQCEVSPFEHRPRGSADMIDRARPRLLFQARSLPIRAFAPQAGGSLKADRNDRRIGPVETGPLSASPPSGGRLAPDGFRPRAGTTACVSASPPLYAAPLHRRVLRGS